MAKKPDFLFNYYRPWEEGSSLIKSALDYNRDMSAMEYQAELLKDGMKSSTLPPKMELPEPSSTINTDVLSRSLRSCGQERGDRKRMFLRGKLDKRFDISEKSTSDLEYQKITLKESFILPDLIEDIHCTGDNKAIAHLGHLKIADGDGVSSVYTITFVYKNSTSYRRMDRFEMIFNCDGNFISLNSTFGPGPEEMKFIEESKFGRPLLCNAISVAFDEDTLIKIGKSSEFAVRFDDVWIDGTNQLAPMDMACLMYLVDPERYGDDDVNYLMENV